MRYQTFIRVSLATHKREETRFTPQHFREAGATEYFTGAGMKELDAFRLLNKWNTNVVLLGASGMSGWLYFLE